MSIDPYFIADLPDTALHDVGDSERGGDLAQIARRFGSVTVDRRAADDFKIRRLGKRAQNVALHAISEEGVFFVLAQIFKREHRDTFLGQQSRVAFRCRC